MDGPSLLTSWTFAPLQLAPIALVAIAYGVRARTLARRGQPVPGWRIALFSLGIALLVVAVASPIAEVGEEELFSFHMVQHLLLGDLAPLCLLAGLTGPLLRPVLALPGVMRLRVLSNPFVALPVWAANLALWHLPALYEGAVESSAVHALEHGAVWIAYRDDLPADQVEVIEQLANDESHVLAAPYPDLRAPVVLTAWERQLDLDDVADERFGAFVETYLEGPTTPEPGAPCDGGADSTED